MEEALKVIIGDMVMQLAGVQSMLAKANERIAYLEKFEPTKDVEHDAV